MLDRRFIRENPDTVRAALKKRGIEMEFDRLLALDIKIVRSHQEREEIKAEQNRLSRSVPTLQGDEKQAAIARSKELGGRIKPLEDSIAQFEADLRPLLLDVPNLPDEEVPDGLDEESNRLERTWGDKPAFDFSIKDHLDIGEALGLIDMKRAVKLAGSRNYMLRGDLLLLGQAVLRFALDLVASRGFIPHSPPVIVRRDAMEGTGYLPSGADQAYECTRDDGWLIGTSEVPLTALHADEILDFGELPLRYAGYSMCFRREAGTSGKDTRGLYRVHQFMKVEQVVICQNDVQVSRGFHEEILQNAEDVMQALELPYRVMTLCGGDMGRSPALTYDIETWMPGRGGYGETHSASRYYDYQARRLNLRYRGEDKKVRFCHTLNSTVIPSPRILVALIENYQNADGSITVPDVLVDYVGKERIGS